jgi:endonuclease/exonuclease/phosphatase family metal-dependent hydrolase
MRFRFASWNVAHRRLSAKHLAILDRIGAHIIAFQEVSRSFHQTLSAANLFRWSFSSHAAPSSASKTKKARTLGCSIFGREPFSPVNSSRLPKIAFPERSLVALLRVERRLLTTCSFHVPPGANWGETKPQTMRAIAQWLADQSPPLIFGIDANSPKIDHPQISRNEWWWEGESSLLGDRPLHQLRDCYRLFLDADPARLARVIRVRPNGPLAVSYFRGHRQSRTACRYDFIYVSPEIRVRRVQYLFDRAVRATSDHAIVIADLQLVLDQKKKSRQRRVHNQKSTHRRGAG